MDYILIVAWFILLIKWADILVDWASSFAKKFWISNIIIGLTIVAFWTSAPELVVNILSWVSGNTDLAISNILWSNISNILLILWITSLIYPIVVPKDLTKVEISLALWVAFLIWILSLDKTIWYWVENWIQFIDSIILWILFAWFLYYTFLQSKKPNTDSVEEEITQMPALKSSIFIILGLAWLILWWKLIVDSAVSIAEWFGLSQAFIGVTIVAVWTSLPELAASVMAALKKNTDMAIGWIIGSNIFNTLWILWATWMIVDLPWYSAMTWDILVNFGSTLLLIILIFIWTRFKLTKFKGSILVLSYFLYIWYLIMSL